MITFESVNKQYRLDGGGLTDINLDIDEGEFVFLTGPSGAGKTTILKLILRQILPQSGKVKVNSMVISDKKFKNTVGLRRTIGVVFQDFKVLHENSVFENVALALDIANTPRTQIKNQVAEVLKEVALESKMFMFPMQLSAGELQRVAIARAIVGNRNIILADEPTGNLDPKTSWDIIKLFKKFEKDKTIILATHNADIVNSLKRRVITVKEGKIASDKKGGSYEL